MAESSGDNQESVLEEAVQRFVDAQLRGQAPDIDEHVRLYPGLESQLRQRIQNLERIGVLFARLTQANDGDFGETAETSSLVGQKLGNFDVIREIGRGGMGVVYLANDTKLDRSVAIKTMPAELAHNTRAHARFQREAKALASLNHPNIAVIYDMIEDSEGSGYLVLEYIPGQTLAERIAHRPLNLDKVLSLAQQIAEALTAAYERGVIHRDIKPGNIKITPEGRVKVLDFGLAKTSTVEGKYTETAVTQPGSIIGTPGYMSPEQIRGKPTDHRSDIWSFGCVLYEMFTGQLAFAGETVSDIAARVLERNPDWTILPRLLPENVRHIIQRCLHKDPRQRFQSASDLAYALKEAQTDSNRTTTTAQPRRIKVMPSVVVTAVLVIIALILYSIYPGSDPTDIQDTVDSLAVLPLENLSEDTNQIYFADGVTDALITELGKISAFRKVMSYSSTARYRDQPKSLPDIASELDVTGIIEGSVQREGQKVRISARLIHAPSERIIWTDSYDRNAQDVLTLQQEIARTVAEQLQITLTPQETKLLSDTKAVNTKAYDAYLLGRKHFESFTAQSFEKAREQFELAIQYDPDLALGYAGMINYYGGRAYWGYQPAKDVMPHVQRLLARISALDDGGSVAIKLVAMINFYIEWDWETTGQSFRRALELNPNDSDLYANYAFYLTTMGRLEEAHEMIDKAIELNLFGPLGAQYGYIIAVEGRLDEAIELLEATPDSYPAVVELWGLYWMKGDYEKAFTACRYTLAQRPGFETAVVALDRGWSQKNAEMRNRYEDAMRLAAQELFADRSTGIEYRPPRLIAKLFLHANSHEQALTYLEYAYEENDPKMIELVDPVWRSLHSEPRFLKIVEKMKIPTGFMGE
ncbi:protein kinase [Planctomycetota bacterium]